MQSKKHSILESIANTAIGFGVNLFTSPLVYYLTGVKTSVTQICTTTLCFTAISVVRNYIIRRYFNKFTKKSK